MVRQGACIVISRVSEVENSFFTGAFSPAAAKTVGAADRRRKMKKPRVTADFVLLIKVVFLTGMFISLSDLPEIIETLRPIARPD
jgi:hypothetical protein